MIRREKLDSMEFSGILREELASGDIKTVWRVEDISGTFELTLRNYEERKEGDLLFYDLTDDRYTTELPDCEKCGTRTFQTGERLICPHCNNIVEFFW